MKRSAGVTLVAVLQIIGSAFTLLVGMLMFGIMTLLPMNKLPPAQQGMGPLLMWVGVIYLVLSLGFGAWGIATAIGLLKLRPWARISTIVYSVLLVMFTIIPAIMMAMIPFPTQPGTDPTFIPIFKASLIAFYLIIAAIGVWWLVYFTRKGVIAQFAGEGSLSTLSARPLSISIIAWWLLICAA